MGTIRNTITTAAPLSNNMQIASTAYADSAVAVEKNRALAAESALSAGVSAATFGWLGWTVDPGNCGIGNQKPVSGRIYLVRLRAVTTGTCGHIGVNVVTGGATLTSGQNFIGLYDTGQTTAGTATLLAQTADQSTTWQTAGYGGSAAAETALTSSCSLTAGQDYLIAILANGTTTLNFWGTTNLTTGTAAFINQGLSGLSVRMARYGTSGQTSLPSTITAGNITFNNSDTAMNMWCVVAYT